MDPTVLAAFDAVASDSDATSWLVVGADKKGKLELTAKGAGGLKECCAQFLDSGVQYVWLRLNRTDDGGDSKRVKFVLLAWVGEASSPMSRMRVSEHKAQLAAVKSTHITLTLTERYALEGLEVEIDAALRKAGGANYDLGNTNSGVQAGGTTGIKSASKAFFEQKDRETEVKSVVFEKHLRAGKAVSACDLGNRAMTASATEAKRNVVGYKAQ